MKGFALFLLLVSACFLLANIMVNDHGYILVAYDNMTFESSLWGMMLLVVISAGVLWLALIALKILLSMLSIVYPVSSHAKKVKSRKLFDRGLAEFTKGNWRRAEKLLGQAASISDPSLINYLTAAKASHEAGNFEASATWLRLADTKTPGAEMAIGITQAQLQLSSNHLEQALATLQSLHKKYPRHAYILKMLKQVYVRLHDWQSLETLLPKLRKLKVINEDEHHQLETKAFQELFAQACNYGRNRSALEDRVQPANDLWAKLSHSQKKDQEILFRYAECLVRLGVEDKAESVLRTHLNQCFSENLIRLYGKISGIDLKKQLLFGESLLNKRPNDPELLLALGRLALKNELWGKAREYLETSLKLRRCVDVYNELGHLLTHLDEFEASARYFQEGLKLAAESATQLPLSARL
ncbi:heme biosynthesis HemY N-terminal domain-containing protein [Endozoicomonas ascidiicola]|uniref:heme biosynthesis HemY N-terminal domain-containing protein n=1 Tax=Endozoicomonas ascidiicola TaxID=1698521 RepID=UPI00082F9459|nr:heme biosynthesis HemY N-terminal domain-containing protein [Endozoicomonas ascidiicola]